MSLVRSFGRTSINGHLALFGKSCADILVQHLALGNQGRQGVDILGGNDNIEFSRRARVKDMCGQALDLCLDSISASYAEYLEAIVVDLLASPRNGSAKRGRRKEQGRSKDGGLHDGQEMRRLLWCGPP